MEQPEAWHEALESPVLIPSAVEERMASGLYRACEETKCGERVSERGEVEALEARRMLCVFTASKIHSSSIFKQGLAILAVRGCFCKGFSGSWAKTRMMYRHAGWK